MCGRYSFFTPIAAAETALQVKSAIWPEWQSKYNAAPTQLLPVITNEFPDIIQFLQWGLIPKWATNPTISSGMPNTRSETIAEKPSFRNIFKYKRCIVLADGYYEWQAATGENISSKSKKTVKQPYRIYVPGNKLLLMAGIWDTCGAEGLSTFSLITCSPNADVADIHHRMPVLLSLTQLSQWLSNETPLEMLLAMLQPAPVGLLSKYPISTFVNKAGNEGEAVIAQVAAKPTTSHQATVLTLF